MFLWIQRAKPNACRKWNWKIWVTRKLKHQEWRKPLHDVKCKLSGTFRTFRVLIHSADLREWCVFGLGQLVIPLVKSVRSERVRPLLDCRSHCPILIDKTAFRNETSAKQCFLYDWSCAAPRGYHLSHEISVVGDQRCSTKPSSPNHAVTFYWHRANQS